MWSVESVWNKKNYKAVISWLSSERIPYPWESVWSVVVTFSEGWLVKRSKGRVSWDIIWTKTTFFCLCFRYLFRCHSRFRYTFWWLFPKFLYLCTRLTDRFVGCASFRWSVLHLCCWISAQSVIRNNDKENPLEASAILYGGVPLLCRGMNRHCRWKRKVHSVILLLSQVGRLWIFW